MTPDDDEPSTSPTLLGKLAAPAGNEDAWRTFLERYGPLIGSWCRRRGLQPSDVEDVTQAVLAKLARALRGFRYDPARRFRGYLRTAVHHAICDLWADAARPGARGAGDSGVLEALARVPAAGGLADEVSGRLEEDGRLFHEALCRVRPQVEEHTWQAFWQTAVEGRRGKDVAARLGLAVGSVYQAKHRVTEMLRDAVTELQKSNEGDRS